MDTRNDSAFYEPVDPLGFWSLFPKAEWWYMGLTITAAQPQDGGGTLNSTRHEACDYKQAPELVTLRVEREKVPTASYPDTGLGLTQQKQSSMGSPPNTCSPGVKPGTQSKPLTCVAGTPFLEPLL